MKKHVYGLGFAVLLFSAMLFPIILLIGLAVNPAVLAILPVNLAAMLGGCYLVMIGKYPGDEIASRVCAGCGRQAPTLSLEFKECRSFVLVRQEREIEGYLCWRCANEIFKKFTRMNLLLGWWSIPGILRTPMLLTMNLAYYLKALKLKPRIAAAPTRKPSSLPEPELAARE